MIKRYLIDEDIILRDFLETTDLSSNLITRITNGNGRFIVNDQNVNKSYLLKKGDKLEIVLPVSDQGENILSIKGDFDIVYEDGDYGFQNIRLYEVYMLCAKDQATIKNKEKTLDYLYKSVESLKKWFDIYRNKRKMRHTSFLVDRLTIDPTTWSFSNDPICQKEELIKEIRKFKNKF